MQESVPECKMWFFSFESLGYVVMLLRDASGMHPGWGSVPRHFVPCCSCLPRAWPSSPLPTISVWTGRCGSLELKRRKCHSFAFSVLVTLMSIEIIGEGLELAEGERLLWDCPGMLRWHMGLYSQPGALLRKNKTPTAPRTCPFQPRKQGDLITSEVTEPQRLIRSDVLSAQVTSLEGGLWSHLCPDPIFQKGVMGVTLRQGEQKGAIG